MATITVTLQAPDGGTRTYQLPLTVTPPAPSLGVFRVAAVEGHCGSGTKEWTGTAWQLAIS